MIRLAVFNVLLLGCCGYAFLRGGAPERIAAAILLIGCSLTLVAFSTSARPFESVEIGILVIDLACLVGLLALALLADRYWPLWVTAFHLIGLAGHAIRWLDPELTRWGYAFVIAVGSYPMLVLIATGTWRHRQRLARFGVDKSWSAFPEQLYLARSPQNS